MQGPDQLQTPSATSAANPAVFRLAIAMMVLGGFLLLAALILQVSHAVAKGLVLISLALLSFGIGEVLNHPKEKTKSKLDQQAIKTITRVIRRRNTCSLGNFFLIVALLFFFTGLKELLFL